MGSAETTGPETGQNDSVESLSRDVRKGAFIIIPAYNEGTCLEGIVREVREVYPNVVVVDDGSQDDTFEVAKRCATYTLRHLINRGQGAALQTGMDFARLRGARFVVTFDADGQHCVEDVAAMLAPIARGDCDITLGSRFLGEAVNLPPSRRWTLRLAVWFTRMVNRVNLTDAHNGLRAFSLRAAERINITLDRMAHASEIIDQIKRSGLPFREVPVKIRYTEYSLAKGQSSRGAMRIVFHYLVGRMTK
ncbi:MAG: glycosyltransferase family 2 protein [Phycisphaerales bacterium]|nr:glycosyltransferase family 2 protein [Phycisphaerales bacterium]